MLQMKAGLAKHVDRASDPNAINPQSHHDHAHAIDLSAAGLETRLATHYESSFSRK